MDAQRLFKAKKRAINKHILEAGQKPRLLTFVYRLI